MSDKWDDRFMDLARLVATWSKDPSTKVGAVIVTPGRIVRGVGYNGFPRGVRDEPERYADRAVKYQLVVHAEANTILNADGSVRGCRLYATKRPCCECAKLIIQAGIAVVVYPGEPVPGDERWAQSAAMASSMFGEAGVDVVELH